MVKMLWFVGISANLLNWSIVGHQTRYSFDPRLIRS